MKLSFRTVLAVGVVAALGASFGVPQHERTVETYRGKTVVWEHTRRWELLPLSEWSVVPGRIVFDKSNGGGTIRRVPFLFVAWEDTTETTFYPDAEVP